MVRGLEFSVCGGSIVCMPTHLGGSSGVLVLG